MGVASNDVSDPSDWLGTSLSILSTLDASLRCQVCKEFYDTPMITSCSHTFCSLCIRRCLSADGKCPTCRSEDQSSKLRRNWTVQECVDAFVKSRKHALDLARASDADDNPKRKRRKVSNSHDNSQNADPPSTRRTRSSARIGSQISTPASQEVIALNSDSDNGGDGDYQPAQEEEKEEPNDGLVACPLCTKRMKEEAVFSHLDRCDGQEVKDTPPPILPQRKREKPPQQRISSPAKHLPHLNYSLLKDAALKKKLQELGTPTWGNRQLLIRRHTQWVDIFNANSDSPRPKSNRDLLKDLDTWERTQGGHAPGQGQTGPTGVMRKDFDGSEWTGRHKSQFDDLIAQARAKRKSAATPKEENGELKPGEAMEGVISRSSAPFEASTNGNMTPNEATLPQNGITPNQSPPISSQEVPSSPVTSMLQSAAQEVRRRSSVSSSAGIATPSIISMSTSSLHPQASNVVHVGSNCGQPSPERDRRHSINPPSADSLPEKLGMASTGIRKMPMFQVPEDPIHDVDLENGNGGG